MTAETLPLFPLNTVLYPGVPLPLHIFEYRYRQLFDELTALEGPQRFGVVAIRVGLEVGEDEQPLLHEVGCVAEVRRATRYDDGRYDVVAFGAARFRLLAVDDSRPYLQASVEYLPERTDDAAEHWAGMAVAAFDGYCAAVSALREEEVTPPDLPLDDPALVSYVLAAATRLDLPEKQELLAIDETTLRLRRALSLLRREIALLNAAPDEVPTEGPFSLN